MSGIEQIIAHSPIFRGVSERTLSKLAQISGLRTYTRGATLFLQGDQAHSIGIVASGWVKLFRIAPNGNEAVVRVFSEGESFGEVVALRHTAYPVSADAASDCTMLWVDANRLLGLIREDSEVAVTMLSSTFIHLHELVNQIEQLKSQNGAQRVAAFLAGLCVREEGAERVVLPYDKALIAAQLGIKPESLSRAFAKLAAQGVRIKHNEAVIENVATLRAYSEEDPGNAWNRRT